MADVVIAPSLLAADFSDLQSQLRLTEQGGTTWVHLDVMDGQFVPNISFGPPVIAALRPHSRMVFDTHLMVDRPERYIANFRDAGADIITVHQEACADIIGTLDRIRKLGARAGVAINPTTPVSVLRDIAPSADLILIMSVQPGFGGQTFIPTSLQKLQEAAALIKSLGRAVDLEVDGGIDESNVADVVNAGANILVAGTSVYRQPDIPSAIRRLYQRATSS